MTTKIFNATAHLCVLDNRLTKAWMQYATSARGLVAEIAEKNSSYIFLLRWTFNMGK